jgi:hypothetical protein
VKHFKKKIPNNKSYLCFPTITTNYVFDFKSFFHSSGKNKEFISFFIIINSGIKEKTIN